MKTWTYKVTGTTTDGEEAIFEGSFKEPWVAERNSVEDYRQLFARARELARADANGQGCDFESITVTTVS